MLRPTRFLTGAVMAAALVTVLAWSPPSSTPAAPAQSTTEAAAPLLDDATIVAIFDYANTVDIETGKLGVERGVSQEVKDFAAMVARDHEAVRQMGRDLAKKLGVTPTPPADSSARVTHQKAMRELRALHGVEFDRAFARHEAAFHKSVIDAINTTLLPAIQNAELRALVVKVAPAFEGHRLAAVTIAERLEARKP